MADTKSKSFWSSIPGFVTGLAGILTGVVGLVTVLIQLDVIGGDDDSTVNTDQPEATATATTLRSGAARSGAGQSGGSTPQFTVTPTAVKLDTLLSKQADVVVRNTGATALTVEDITLSGTAASEFTVDKAQCTADELDPNTSCSIEVKYEPSARGDHSATLRIEVAGAASPQQVSLTGSRPL